jgi:hypothetical protein
MLEKILKSEWAKKQMEEYEDEKLAEIELKEIVVEDFFFEDLETILKVLPELWDEIKREVEIEVANVLGSPKEFEDAVVTKFGRQCLEVEFDLGDFLEDVCEEIVKTLRGGEK